MNNNINSENQQRDEELWAIARKRAAFRRHLFTYIVVNSFLWLIWAIRSGDYDSFIPWPIWPTLGWGVGLAINYADAYLFHRENSVEQEYQKLLKKKQGL
jgi:2TM domain